MKSKKQNLFESALGLKETDVSLALRAEEEYNLVGPLSALSGNAMGKKRRRRRTGKPKSELNTTETILNGRGERRRRVEAAEHNTGEKK